MSCCCATENVFENSLHYSSPAHGGWGVLKMGHLIPESYTLFVSPAACGRHGALAARMEERKNRVSYLFLSEDDIVSGGYEDLLIQAVGKLLKHLEKCHKVPKVLELFVSCIDDLLGTDHDALIQELSELYPHIRFIFCHMNPTSTDTGVPPAVNIQNKNYSLLDVTKERDGGVNIIGNLAPLRSNGELFQILKDMGVSEIRHISDYDTFAGYQEMAKSGLNLVVTPTGKYASVQMEKKHGIPYQMALTSFQTDSIKETYENIAKQLEKPCPEVSSYEKEAKEALEKTAEALNGMPVIIDGEAIVRPFDLAKALLQAGINVQCVFEQKVLPSDEENFQWVIEHYPNMTILQPQNPKVTVLEKHQGDCLSIGYSAAYITGAKHVVDIAGQHGLYGYQGIIDLAQMMEEASKETADLKKLLDEAVIVV